jgi:N-acetylmuramoyl-L-alanine amidase
VLHRSACSSVLVELGFISNYNEELYLASTTGQREMAQAIYSAFVKYKNSHDKKLGYVNNDAIHDATQQSGSSSASVDQPVIVETVTTPLPEDNTIIAAGRKPVFKLQITASTRELSPTNVNFKGLKELDYYREGGYYKYTVGASSKYEDIDKLRVELKKRFPDAFIVAFLGDKKIPVDEARKIAK